MIAFIKWNYRRSDQEYNLIAILWNISCFVINVEIDNWWEYARIEVRLYSNSKTKRNSKWVTSAIG